jgi:hypothetical protein
MSLQFALHYPLIEEPATVAILNAIIYANEIQISAVSLRILE